MKPDLTPMEAKFYKAYLETSNLAESAKRAGYRCNTISNYSNKGRMLLNRLELTFPEILSICGVTDDLIANKTFEGLNATRTMLASFQGKFLDSKEIDDFPTRSKYLELAARMKGHLIDKKEITGSGGGDIVLQVAPATPKGKGKVLELDLE